VHDFFLPMPLTIRCYHKSANNDTVLRFLLFLMPIVY